ncbi:MAG TPA: pentapeptide repeat-containing protein, partial [Saprospiraceae bacterium]|nr:pentapeptide repeat-containing protein [Saprospiraceae bacterium]
RENESTVPDLSEADLTGINLFRVNLSMANLTKINLDGANLSGANMIKADLSWADLHSANLGGADLSEALLYYTCLVKADLYGAYLNGANLFAADLRVADLSNADLRNANLVGTNLENATIINSNIYGINVWDVKKDGLKQQDLIIAPYTSFVAITIDDLEIAQFIYLLLNNQKFRDIIETVTSKAVLILGRFTEERKKILDAIRDELRNRNFLPILFDFEKPDTRDLTETVSILAKLSRFVIADLTDAKSIPQELSHIVPNMPSLPVIPLILKGQQEYGMFEHWRPYPWVLPIYEYEDEGHLISTLSAGVIEPAERKVQEIRGK